MTGAAALPTSQAALAADRDSQTGLHFPPGFRWGTATAAYQIEGAVHEDGRGPSIWDTFCHEPGKIRDGSTADVACDHYHRVKEDVALMKALGVSTYRFSISWPRIFPEGRGTPNPKGLAFYDRLVDELLANGIEPFATLYHWDLPQAVHDSGGWESRDTAQARHHAVLAHGLAVQAIRANGRKDTLVGPAENISVALPALPTAADIAASESATREMNAGYLTVMMEGRYTDAFLTTAGADAPRFTPEELKIISTPVDFVGLNVYTPDAYVRASDTAPKYTILPVSPSYPRMLSRWLLLAPETAYWAPHHAVKLWQVKDIFITENGTSATDEMAADGAVYDLDRVMFLREYLMHLQRAATEGLPVRGYFLWSLLDNFEWEDGLSVRFGLHHVDYQTLKRTPKLSASFYREVVARNSLT